MKVASADDIIAALRAHEGELRQAGIAGCPCSAPRRVARARRVISILPPNSTR